MTSPLLRRLTAFVVIGALAAGCASSSDSANDAAGDTGAAESELVEPFGTDDAAEGSAGAQDESEATSIPVPENDSAADAPIAEGDGEPTPEPLTADRAATARDFVRAGFNIDPEPAWVECIVAEAQQDDALDTALQTPSVARGDVDDAEMRALTTAMNGCVQTISLADWATQAVGPRGEVQDTAPPCFVERFDDPDSGDVTFYNFVALTFQFRLEPDGVDDLVDALVECTPITSLTGFFAEQAEAATNFQSVVDRNCLDDVLRPPEVSQEFWDVFVSGSAPPVQVIEPYAQQCTTEAYDGLAEAVPGDFVAWSGNGALASVAPPARNEAYDASPPMTIDPTSSYEAVIATGGGEIRVRLFAGTTPVTVNNFVGLARDGYYDQTVFHRVIDGFMAQAGDPTGTGSGGPGYQFEDEFENGETFDRPGLLAMANSGANTNGSQFFITFEPAEHLNGAHTIFGEVVEGMDIVDAIQRRDPDAPSGRGQTIESITIVEN